MSLRNSIALGLLVSMTTVASTVFALDPDGELLAGPSVQDEEVTQEDMRAEQLRVTGKGDRNQQSQQQVRLWMKTLQSLDLSKEQQTEIQSLVHQLQKAQEEFQKTYGAELAKIREEQRKANSAAFAAQAAKEAENANVLMKLAPKPEEYQAKAWALLTENQQKDFQKKYQSAIEEMKKRRENRMGKGAPMMGDDQRPKKGISRDDFNGRDRDRARSDSPKNVEVSADEAASRRVRFLRRLRQLENEN
jgi:hypothetical protein